MALTQKEIEQIKDELDNCKNPLIFFDDDPDGLCSFLLFYRYKREGKGVVVKSKPALDEKFLRKVDEYDPDKVFILDIPNVTQEFFDGLKISAIWIDHHEPLKRSRVKYFNPLINDCKNEKPISYWCYKVVEQDLWVAMAGMVGDWFLPEFAKEFSEKYPDILPADINKPEDALFKTRLGELVRIFSFSLKGNISDTMKCVKILTRVESPYEILEKSTTRSRFLHKKYERIRQQYMEILEDAVKTKIKDDMLVYIYPGNKMSFTSDLSNELLYMFPDKLIIVGREKSGEVRCSLRSNKDIQSKLKKALEGIDGYGGGHEHACGANIKKKDFRKFVKKLKKLV